MPRIRRGLRVLYMSGYSRNAVVHQGRLDDEIEHLQKPITQTLWPHGSEMCWIGRQQAATSHSQGTTLVGLENFHYGQSWATIVSVSAKIGCTAQTLLEWVKKAEVDSGKRVRVPPI